MVVQKVNGQNKEWRKCTDSWSGWRVLLKWNFVVNQYLRMSDVLYTFTPNKSYDYLLNVEPNNLVFLKTYYPEFVITFMDWNGRPLEIKDKVSLTLLINKYRWHVIL